MVENVVMNPFGLVLIVTAHMVFSDPSNSVDARIVGQNITFHFTFSTNITKHSQIAIYKSIKETKISEYSSFKSNFEVYPENSAVFYHKMHLTLNDTDVYWATLFDGNRPPILSNKVQLVVREDNRSTTVSPVLTKLPKLERSGSSFAAHILLMVSPLMLLVALLPFLICCFEKTKDRREEEPQRGSNPTVQETIEESNNVPGPSLVYSILDFPKRLPAAVEFQPSGTEYATVSYLTEKRQRPRAEECKHAHRS